MMRKLIVPGLTALGLVFTACSGAADTAAPAPAAAEVASPTTGNLLSLVDAQEMTAAGNITLIDVRTPTEWRMTGLPPGADRADFKANTFKAEIARITGGDKTAPIALICRSGNRSSKATAQLKAAGYTNVFDVTDGMKGWRAANLPTEDCNC